jgi:hypothetical protein
MPRGWTIALQIREAREQLPKAACRRISIWRWYGGWGRSVIDLWLRVQGVLLRRVRSQYRRKTDIRDGTKGLLCL